MRIGIDGLILSDPLTGIGHYTLELARHLALNNGSDEYLLVSPRPLSPANNLLGEKPANLGFQHLTLNPFTRHWWSIGLPRFIRSNRIQLFHGTNFEVPLRQVCATVVTIHDLSILLHPETQQRKIVRRRQRRLPLMARSATIIVTPTGAVRDEVAEHLGILPEKIEVVPEAARRLFKRLEPEHTLSTRMRLGIHADFLLYVGTLEPRKNLLTLVRAFEEVLRKRANGLQLVLAGRKGWMLDDLLTYVSQSPARDQIIFTGYLSDQDLCALYSACLVFVYPSVYEGFGLPPLEAMACGAPVITSRISSITEVVGSGARGVDPYSSEELSEAVIELLDDRALRERLSAAGKNRAQSFSWTETARRMRDIYHEAMQRFDSRS
ncbi:MAG TPA: glycosyltransferase family 1 protein [Pyrinomonadaceae bacterium]|nr:glycosyltransferase family 1 protein [Pyrinomonadaceae bacterium]